MGRLSGSLELVFVCAIILIHYHYTVLVLNHKCLYASPPTQLIFLINVLSIQLDESSIHACEVIFGRWGVAHHSLW